MKTLRVIQTLGFCAAALIMVLSGCATSDTTLREQGRSEAYILGFHDGRHSGMKEAGNYLEHRVQDLHRFETDADYKTGWLAGEAEGIRMQEQANAASNSYQADKIARDSKVDVDAIGKKATKGIDTSTLKSLEK